MKVSRCGSYVCGFAIVLHWSDWRDCQGERRRRYLLPLAAILVIVLEDNLGSIRIEERSPRWWGRE